MRGSNGEQGTLTLPPDFRGKLNREDEDGFAAKKQKAQKGTEGRREEGTGGAEKRSGGQPLSGNGDATTEDTKDTERI